MVKKQKEKQYNSAREQRDYSQWRSTTTASTTVGGETQKSLPYNYCCLSLTPYHNPVCTKDGIMFDNDSIVPFILQQNNQEQSSSLSIPNLSLNDLITLHMDQDDEENEQQDDNNSTNNNNANNNDDVPKWKCPILDKRYTNYTKMVAIIVNDPTSKKKSTTTNNNSTSSKEAYVYSYDAYYELNIKCKNYIDLTTGYTFNKNTDVIILNDPNNILFNQTRTNWINININKINKKQNTLNTTTTTTSTDNNNDNTNIKHSVSGTRILEKMKVKQENDEKEKQRKQQAIQKQEEEENKRLSKKRSIDQSNNNEYDIDTILLLSQRCSLTNIKVLKQDIGISSTVESQHQQQQNQSLFLTSTSTGKKTITNQSDDNNNIATSTEIDDYQFNLIKQQLKKKYKNTGYNTNTTSLPPSTILSSSSTTNGKGYVEMEISITSNSTSTVVPLLFELHCDIVPKTCTNFITLCLQNWYNNTTFHRLIANFMIQGGSHNPHKKKIKSNINANNNDNNTNTNTTTITKKDCSIWGTGVTFNDEFDKSLQHTTRGIIAMANTGCNTNLCQFYITFASCQHLDNKHTIFGNVINATTTTNTSSTSTNTALDILEKVKTNTSTNEPIQPITIISTKVIHNPLSTICSTEYNRLQSIHNTRISQQQQQQLQQKKKNISSNNNDETKALSHSSTSHSNAQTKQQQKSSTSSIGRYL